jgi:tellurite resistance protein TerC
MILAAWWGSTDVWIVVGFHVFIGTVLVLDLGVLRPAGRTVRMTEAALWSALWIALALIFALAIWKFWYLWSPDSGAHGREKALEFIAGYLIEKALSIDNLFVFLVIFRYFAVPPAMQHGILVWGLVGALLLRAGMILGGIALLDRFHWLLYVLGVFLIYTGIRLCRNVDREIDPSTNLVVRCMRRLLPVHVGYDSSRWLVKEGGSWHVTTVALVLLVIESTDVLFALDSIPAVFGITTDPFIVYTSNVFAILGLRSLYFVLAGFLGMFRYLNVGLGVVLASVGVKMLVGDWYPVPVQWSLVFIAAVLTSAIAVSLLAKPREHSTLPSQAVSMTSQDLGPEETATSSAAREVGTGHEE